MEKQSILILEDNPEMQMVLSAILGVSYRIKIAATANEAYRDLKQSKYDLLLIDVDLPDESGFQFSANIKLDEALGQIPFIFLTAHDQTSDIVLGFSLGADDYITKPIVKEQFKARISARLRKQALQEVQEKVIRLGKISLDLFQQKASVLTESGPKDAHLTSIEFRLLRYFLEHSNRVLSREQLLNAVWGNNLSVTDRTVDTHVYSLRKKLGPVADCICTVSGIGYQFKQSDFEKAS